MRSVLLTEELMGVVLKFSRKSANMGSLWVSWDVPRAEKIYGRKNLTQKVQIVFSLCFGIFMLSMLLFLLCSLDVSEQPWVALPRLAPSRRWIAQRSSVLSLEEGKSEEVAALQGLGKLFRRGTKGMSELVVAHLSEDLKIEDFRLFLRTLHRSGVSARADIILLFPWSPLPSQMRQVIQEEERYFQELLLYLTASFKELHENRGTTTPNGWGRVQQPVQVEDERAMNALEPISIISVPLSSNATLSKFNCLAFNVSAERTEMMLNSEFRRADKGLEERGSFSRRDWGSISGYEMAELDPSDALGAFLDSPSADLRRWFCYQILLGMLRHKYKHVLLTEAGKVLILGDALSAVRDSNLLYLTTEDRTWIEEAQSSKHSDKLESLARAKEPLSITDQVAVQANDKTSGDKDFVDSQVELLPSEPAEKGDDVGTGSIVLEHGKMDLSNGRTRKNIKQKNIAKKRATRSKGLMESVYGREMWLSLETEEKQNKLLVSNVVMGAMRPIRGLANAMSIEIVRVALQRRNKHAFSDQALLNYLIQKSSVLGKKVMDHLLIVSNKESVIHSLSGSRQSDILIRDCGDRYAVVENYAKYVLEEFGGQNFATAVKEDLCSSPLESSVYRDCKH